MATEEKDQLEEMQEFSIEDVQRNAAEEAALEAAPPLESETEENDEASTVVSQTRHADNTDNYINNIIYHQSLCISTGDD